MPKRSYIISETISNLILQQPFIAVLLVDLCNIVETDSIPIAATDGRNIMFNTEALKKFTVPERVFIMAHEVLHVIFQHIPRSRPYIDTGFGPDSKPLDKGKLNVSQDYIINFVLQASNIGKMPEIGFYDSRYNDKLSFEQVYEMLEDTPKNSQGNNGFDEHIQAGNSLELPTDEEVKRSLISAASTAKAQGKISENFERLVKELVEPQQDWREILKQFLITTTGHDQPSWQRTNRRRLVMSPHIAFPYFSGTKIGDIAVIIDTSGSISTKELQIFLSELQRILDDVQPEDCRIFWTDSAVKHVDELTEDTNVLNLRPKGGGGTNMPAAYPVIDENFPGGVDCIVCLTDGHTPYGTEPGVPIIWAITTEVVAPYGTSIQLKV